MGTFQVELEIGDPQGGRWEKLQGTVGTKAANAWVPQSVLERLGVRVEKRVSLRHPDGRLIKRDVGQASLRIGDKSIVGRLSRGERDPGSDRSVAAKLRQTLKEQLVPCGERR
jgi:hypothetical protein